MRQRARSLVGGEMASGNSAQSAAHQQNISIQFSFYQRTVYETSTHPPKPCGSKKEDAGLRIRAHEQIIQREAGRMARYTTRCLESIIHGRLPINTELLDLDYILLIGKHLLETWEQRKRANELIDPQQMVKTQLYVDRLTKLLHWLEAIVKLALGI